MRFIGKNIHDTGVYLIFNKVNFHFYIGSTIAPFYKRKSEHKRSLEKGIHHSQYLQNSWNKYGAENFAFLPFYILDRKTCHIGLYRCLEQEFINLLKPQYNTTNNVYYIYTSRSEEEKEKMAIRSSKEWIVVSPENVRSKILNLKKFCNENELSDCEMMKIARGEILSYKGWKCYHADKPESFYEERVKQGKINLSKNRKNIYIPSQILINTFKDKKIQTGNERTFEVKFSNGLVMQIKNLYHFAKHFGLCRKNLTKVAHGQRPHHRGVKIKILN